MRVLLYHPVKLPVFQYGGTERVLMWLCQTLYRMGHKVSVFAAVGSFMPDGIECLTDPVEVLRRAKDWDVLHGFTKPPQEFYDAFQNKVLVTIHGNGKLSEKFHRNTVFLSRNHAARNGAKVFVYNGLDPAELKFSEKARQDRYLFLSKTSWRVKNLKGAVRLCTKFHQNLAIAGGERPYGLRLYSKAREVVGGQLGLPGMNWNWVGSVNQEEKANFLISGKALLFPILWNEPFGLVITESLVSGTPVIAHPFGSVPELLEFAPQCVVNPFDADYFDRMGEIFKGGVKMPSALDCREWVLKHFQQETMTQSYLSLYARVEAGEFLHEREPETIVGPDEISGALE